MSSLFTFKKFPYEKPTAKFGYFKGSLAVLIEHFEVIPKLTAMKDKFISRKFNYGAPQTLQPPINCIEKFRIGVSTKSQSFRQCYFMAGSK